LEVAIACEEAWKQAWELVAKSSEALHEMLSISPYTDLRQAGPITQADLMAQVRAQVKYANVENAWLEAVLAALEISETQHHT
jgi:hypothetical protein